MKDLKFFYMEEKGKRLFIKGSFNNFNENISFYTFLKWESSCNFVIETLNFNSDFQIDKNEFLEKLTHKSAESSDFIESMKLQALVQEW